MARILIGWSRPRHVDALDWARGELAPLLNVPEVRSISLARVYPASQHSRACDWLCELFLHEGADATICVERPECSDWIRDMYLLGLRPRVVLVDDDEEVVA